jgi:hypothetical protein
MLIKRAYEIDPLTGAHCGGQMKVVAFLGPPQPDVIEKILSHCGLWSASAPRAPPADNGVVHEPGGEADSPSASDERAGTDVRGRSHVLGDLLMFPDTRRLEGGTRPRRNPPWTPLTSYSPPLNWLP